MNELFDKVVWLIFLGNARYGLCRNPHRRDEIGAVIDQTDYFELKTRLIREFYPHEFKFFDPESGHFVSSNKDIDLEEAMNRGYLIEKLL